MRNGRGFGGVSKMNLELKRTCTAALRGPTLRRIDILGEPFAIGEVNCYALNLRWVQVKLSIFFMSRVIRPRNYDCHVRSFRSFAVCFSFILAMLLPRYIKGKPAYPEAMKTQSQSRHNLILGLLGTTQQTSSPSSNETSLLTLGSVSRDGRSLTDMLMVTTLDFVSTWF